MTPSEARKPSNELEAYVSMKLKAKHNRNYPDIAVGDKVYIYMKRSKTQKAHVSLWSDMSYEVLEITHSHGITFYQTTAREQGFLRHEIREA